jgi:hypothetical protein
MADCSILPPTTTPSLCQLCASKMVRFAMPLGYINVAEIPCPHQPPHSHLCSSRMPSQSRRFSLANTVVEFCRSLPFKMATNPSVRRAQRPQSFASNRQYIPIKAQQILGVDMNGNDTIPLTVSIESTWERSSAVMNGSHNALHEVGRDPSSSSAEQEISSTLDEVSSSATSGVRLSPFNRSKLFIYASPFVQCFPGGAILDSILLEDDASGPAESSDAPTTASERSTPESRGPSPEFMFTPLSPPPSHRKARKPDAILEPDDPRAQVRRLCRYFSLMFMVTRTGTDVSHNFSEHACFLCSECSRRHQNEPLRFPF